MSKQVNRVNKFGMETGLPTRRRTYNFFVNPSTCKTDSSFLTIHYNAGHTYRMQEMVKEVTLKNHSNKDLQFCMKLSFLPRRYTEL